MGKTITLSTRWRRWSLHLVFLKTINTTPTPLPNFVASDVGYVASGIFNVMTQQWQDIVLLVLRFHVKACRRPQQNFPVREAKTCQTYYSTSWMLICFPIHFKCITEKKMENREEQHPNETGWNRVMPKDFRPPWLPLVPKSRHLPGDLWRNPSSHLDAKNQSVHTAKETISYHENHQTWSKMFSWCQYL